MWVMAYFKSRQIPGSMDLGRFSAHHSGATIEQICLGDVPAPAMEMFEGLSRRFILPEEYREGNFDVALRIDHGADQTYAVKQVKHYEKDSEDTVYLADMADLLVGRGEVRFKPVTKKAYFKGKPFEEYTETAGAMGQGHMRRGLGIRRTRLMNALSHVFWGLPLHSSTQFIHHRVGDSEVQPAKLVWEKLVRLGEARKYDENGLDRYAFLR